MNSKNFNIKTFDDSIIETESALEEFYKIKALAETKNILYAAGITEYKLPYLERIAEEMQEYRLLIMVENGRSFHGVEKIFEQHYGKVESDTGFSYFPIPTRLMRDNFASGVSVEITSDMKRIMDDMPYVKEAAINLAGRYPEMGEGYAELSACEIYKYLDVVLNTAKPVMVIIWNQFLAMNYILNSMCKEREIKVIYNEYGVLPGTVVFEQNGQMGESFVSSNSEIFNTLSVNEDDLEKADKVWKYLRLSGLNRKKQPVNNAINKIKDKLKPGRPIILYFGQNDYESGLYPYTKHTKEFHSPTFTSSDDAALYLAEIANKNDWNFLYKRHPIISERVKTNDYPLDIILMDNTDINSAIDMADICVTILSQSGYISTIRKKATLMLGYNQLYGKGCSYEAFRREDVETALYNALENGFTPAQEESFRSHIARLLRYYLYDDIAITKKFSFANDVHKGILFLKYALNGQNQLECMNSIAKENDFLGTGISMMQSLREISHFAETNKKPVFLFVGHVCFDHEIDYVYQLAKQMPAFKFVILTEHYRATYKKIYDPDYVKLYLTEPKDIHLLKFFIVPELFTKNQYPPNRQIFITQQMKELIDREPCINEAVVNLKGDNV
ncbi:hypothetical protein [Sediminispirochaeta bajacaliforniensis]|uniref:hypothetical protein n=1 Tax=Sediminispirochaeta bajacaliforniensis TaxID=148 RepID=UPI000368147F|nr:hypothetical protein [Sediminispirochaeta bajacaliforniensis]